MNMRALGLRSSDQNRPARARSDWPDPGWLALSLAAFVVVTTALVVVLTVTGVGQ